jgi:amino-acid N-acetyltransferase
MRYEFASPQDELKIKQLLAAGDLHHHDIEASQLRHFLLAKDQSEIVGVVGLEIQDNFALLRSLAVDSAYRNRGLATQLVRKIETYAKSSKVNALYVLTMTAEGFFAKCGYRRTSREAAPAGIQATTEFRSLCPVSAACMVKHL